MRNLFLWYLPQAALFGAGWWVVRSEMSATGEPNGLAAFAGGLLLAAAYTGAVNLGMNLFARLRRRTALSSESAETSGHSLSLSGTRSSPPQSPKQIDGVRVRE